MKRTVTSLAALLGCLLFLHACQKPVAPVELAKQANLLRITVQDYTDSATGTYYYKIRFEKDSSTWDPKYLGQPALYRIFRKYGNSAALLAGQVFYDPDTSRAGDTLYYVSGGHAEAVVAASGNFFLDTADVHDFSSLRYEAVTVTNLDPLSGGAGYSNGLCGDTSRSAAIPGTLPIHLSINSGQANTASNVVDVEITFDTTNVKTLSYYRYSAFIPLDSFGGVKVCAEKALDLPFKLARAPGYIKKQGPAQGRYPQFDTVFVAKTDTIQYMAGLVAKKFDIITKDLFDPASASAKMFTSLSYDGHSKKFTLIKKDTLLPGYGKKWIVLYRNSTKPAVSFPPLYDDIDIRSFNMSIKMDITDRRNFLFDEVSIIAKKICVLTDDIPVIVDTYGDTTFESEVYIWIATRKGYSDFYTKLKGEFNNGFFKNSSLGNLWPDCIFETKPETAFFNGTGQLRKNLLGNFDYVHGFRVSPLSVMTSQPGDSLAVNAFSGYEEMPILNRGDTLSKSLISTMVKPGSILGYSESDLNTFKYQTIFTDSITHTTDAAFGWHDAVTFDAIKGTPRIKDYVTAHYSADAASQPLVNGIGADFCMDLDGRLYQHPFRGLPNTSITLPGISAGVKEFVVIIYARGKYFGEPRVSVSKYSTVYNYVWDKIPPQFVWCINETDFSPVFDPQQSPIYAPMCVGDKCTDFAALPGVFDVYFSPLTTAFTKTSVRDMGFGRIRAVRLLFNYSANYLSSDPLTGERKYLTPTISYDLPRSEIDARQVKNSFYDVADKTAPKIIGASYGLPDVAFKGIDFSGWQTGLWDMWVETEDDLGNRGLAPHGIPDATGSKGFLSIRRLLIK